MIQKCKNESCDWYERMKRAALGAKAGRCRCCDCGKKLLGWYHICNCGGTAVFVPEGILLIEDEGPHECK